MKVVPVRYVCFIGTMMTSHTLVFGAVSLKYWKTHKNIRNIIVELSSFTQQAWGWGQYDSLVSSNVCPLIHARSLWQPAVMLADEWWFVTASGVKSDIQLSFRVSDSRRTALHSGRNVFADISAGISWIHTICPGKGKQYNHSTLYSFLVYMHSFCIC